VYLQCASSSRPKLTFPRQLAETHQRTLANTEILGEVALTMSLRRGLQTHVNDISVSMLVPLLVVIKPTNVRALPHALLSASEQYLVAHAAEVMEDCGLEYKLGTREKKWSRSGSGGQGGWGANSKLNFANGYCLHLCMCMCMYVLGGRRCDYCRYMSNMMSIPIFNKRINFLVNFHLVCCLVLLVVVVVVVVAVAVVPTLGLLMG
jgi:hypothetical protein